MYLTNMDVFVKSNAAQEAFEIVKRVMCTCPYLSIPNFLVSFMMECDASKLGIGLVLMQKGQLIVFEK